LRLSRRFRKGLQDRLGALSRGQNGTQSESIS
jgi:hypothetical protein